MNWLDLGDNLYTSILVYFYICILQLHTVVRCIVDPLRLNWLDLVEVETTEQGLSRQDNMGVVKGDRQHQDIIIITYDIWLG